LSALPKTMVPPLGPPTVTAPSSKPGTSTLAPVSSQPAGTLSEMPCAESGMSGAAVGTAVGFGGVGLSSPPPARATIAMMPSRIRPPTIAAGMIQRRLLGPAGDGWAGGRGGSWGGAECGISVSATTGGAAAAAGGAGATGAGATASGAGTGGAACAGGWDANSGGVVGGRSGSGAT
jgi:hypothetical protein